MPSSSSGALRSGPFASFALTGLLGALLLGCPQLVVAPLDSGSNPPPADSDSGVDASVDAGPDDAGQPGDAGPPRTANLLLVTASVSAGSTTSLTFTNAVADAGERCFAARVGPCLTIDCSAATPLDLVPAGELQVLRDGGVVISALPDDAGLYPTTNRGGAQWAPGDALVVRATGAVVPAFSTALAAPPRVVPVNLLEPDGGTPLLVRTRDFPVHWLALDAGVAVVVTQLGPQGVISARRVVCDFDGAGALGVIPASAVGSLEAGRATALSVSGLAVKELSPGGYRLRVQLTTATPARADVADGP